MRASLLLGILLVFGSVAREAIAQSGEIHCPAPGTRLTYSDGGRIEAVADRIEKRIQEMGETEIESRIVGEELMKELHQLDQVAYVRFASVYREFKDIDQFMDELRTLAQQRRER